MGTACFAVRIHLTNMPAPSAPTTSPTVASMTPPRCAAATITSPMSDNNAPMPETQPATPNTVNAACNPHTHIRYANPENISATNPTAASSGPNAAMTGTLWLATCMRLLGSEGEGEEGETVDDILGKAQ